MNRTLRGRVVSIAISLLFLLAIPALGQERGVRKLEQYREVSPYYEIPTLSTGFLSFTPETELDLGFARVHAFLGENVLYESNVYLSDRDTTSDVSFNTTPGFLAQMFSGDHRLQLFYAPTIRFYADESDLDTVNHDANAEIRLDFVDSYARVADVLTMTQDARDINFAGRVDRTTNRLEAEVGALSGDTGLGVRGRWHARIYGKEIPAWQDLDEYSAGFFLRWAGHPDYAVLFEYELLTREYRDEVLNDSTTHTTLLGLEGRPLEDLDYLVKAGIAYLRAEDTGQLEDDSDLLTLVVEAQTRLRVWTGLSARLFYVQRPEYAVYSNYQMAYRGGASFNWALDPGWIYLRGVGYIEYADPSNEPSLTLYSAGAAAGANAASWMKLEVGYEWRKRLGAGTLDYEANNVYAQGVVYF